jgi:hypothetical protein
MMASFFIDADCATRHPRQGRVFRAGQYQYLDVEKAAASLHGLIDGKRHALVTA